MAAADETFEQVSNEKLKLQLLMLFLFQFEEDEATDNTLTLCGAGRKRLFSKELRCMMYGFGDDQNPYTESVDIIEDLVIEFITETTHKYVRTYLYY